MSSQKIGRLTADGMDVDRLIMHVQTCYLQTSNICSSDPVARIRLRWNNKNGSGGRCSIQALC